jgi:uncharacterized linocin/CFP29 family protein
MGQIRVAQKVFPTITVAGASNVPADVFDPASMTIEEGRTKSMVEPWVPIGVTQSQLDNEPNLHILQTLAKLGAKYLAQAEDTLIFQGGGKDVSLPPQVRVINRDSAGQGLLGVADKTVTVNSQPGKPGVYGEETFKAVAEGIALLIRDGQPGPYGLFLHSTPYADTFAPIFSNLVTTYDRLTPLLTGGFYGTGTLPEFHGLLVSLGGEPTTIYVGVDAITGYTQEDEEGIHRFRIFERVQFVARDPQAFVKLVFKDR